MALAFDIEAIGKEILSVAKVKLGDHYQQAKPFADQSFRQLAQNLEMITTLKITGKINEEQAKLHFDIYKSSVRITLLTIEGLGLVAAQEVIDASLAIVKDVVNTAIGFVLI
jgi:hypothetical protein